MRSGKRGSALWCAVVLSVVLPSACGARGPTNVAETPPAPGTRTAAAPPPVAPAPPVASTVAVARPGDRDGDGWVDEDDLCPDAAEDADDCYDEDGCPDPDNDDDGIPDTADRCPNEHNRRSGRDGCPAPLPPNTVVVESTDECFIMLESVDFRTNEAELGAERRAILDRIAEHFRRCNNIVFLEIHGRKGEGERDAELPMKRAEVVRADLVAKGVDPRRLRAMTDKAFAEPRTRDRRTLRAVEFKVPRGLTCGRAGM